MVDFTKARDVDFTKARDDGIRPPACPRCGTTMKDVVTIAPVADLPGLIAYECPDCIYVMSVLTHFPPPGGEG